MKQLFTLLTLIFTATTFAQNVGIGTTTPTDQLHTTGNVRLQKYSGATTRLVQIDSSGRLVATAAGAVFSNSTPQAISDNGCATGFGITSGITVSGQPNVTIQSGRIAIKVNITHPFVGDLKIYLISSTSEVLTLANSNGGSGNNFINTIFTDQASTAISTGVAPFTGQYKPIGGLVACTIPNTAVSNFAAIGGGNILPNGTWTLKVFDAAGGDVGTLVDWAISFTGPESITTADENNFIPKLVGGNLLASNIFQPAGSSNIGIGTTNPTVKLEVNGDFKATTLLPFAIKMTPNAGTGKVLTSDASGNGTWQENKINFYVKGDYTCGTCNGTAPYFNSMVRNAYVELIHLRDTIKKSGNYLVILTATGRGVDEYNTLYDATDNRSDYEGYLRIAQPGYPANVALLQKDIFYTKYSNPSNTTVTFEYHTDDGEKSAIVFLNAGDIIKTFGYVTQFIGPNAPAQVNGWSARAQVKLILLN